MRLFKIRKTHANSKALDRPNMIDIKIIRICTRDLVPQNHFSKSWLNQEESSIINKFSLFTPQNQQISRSIGPRKALCVRGLTKKIKLLIQKYIDALDG